MLLEAYDEPEDLGEIGRGGMGTVHRVLDRRILREIARKRLPRSDLDPSSLGRFIVEAQTHGQLEHPNIVPVHGLGFDANGAVYLDMKLVRGRTLHELIDDVGERRLQADVLSDHLGVFLKVCDALAYAHSRGVIHQDLKPENIMVGEFGQVYVMDWGIALVTDDGAADGVLLTEALRSATRPDAIIGTPAFMAPEQLVESDAVPLGPHTDVFQLGALLYVILTGRGPYEGLPLIQTIARAQRGMVTPPEEVAGPDVPPALSRICMTAMAATPDERTPSVMQLKREIESFLRGSWNLVRIEVPAGETFLFEGDPGHTAYVIEEGRCEVFTVERGGERVLRELGPGEVFGETAVFTDKPRSASIRAATDVRLLQVDRHTLTEGLGLNTWMGAFVRALAHRFREADERLRALEGDEP